MLKQQLVITPSTHLEQRWESWGKRVKACYEAGLPEMVPARTKRFENLGDEKSLQEFRKAETFFVEEVFRVLDSFLEGTPITNVLELFAGSGTFSRELCKRFQRVFCLDFREENIEHLYAQLPQEKSVIIYSPAHMVLAGDLMMNEVEVVFAFRGFLHQPPKERRSTIKQVLSFLKEKGLIVIVEMFEDDRPIYREINPGTWYWTIKKYEKILGPAIVLSLPIDNDGDPCRIAIFQKAVAPVKT